MNKENNFLNIETLKNPADFFCELRENSPIYFDNDLGAFVVSRYEDVTYVLKNAYPFSSASSLFGAYNFEDIVTEILNNKGSGPFYPVLSRIDPPEHARFRQALSQAFSVQRVAKLQPYIDELTSRIFDSFVDKNEVEVMSAIGVPLPVKVIAHLLNVPDEHAMNIKRWSDSYAACVGNTLQNEEMAVDVANNLAEMQSFLKGHIEQRRQAQQDDLLNDILYARSADGQPLSDGEIISVCASFMAAGHGNVSLMILYIFKVLAENPLLIASLRDSEDLDKSCKLFVEEAMRYCAPIRMLSRVAADDIALKGVNIPKGSRIIAVLAAANEDVKMFGETAGSFLPDRTNARAHLAFGGGPHVCLGNILARAELGSVLKAIVQRLANIKLGKNNYSCDDYAPVVMNINVHLNKLNVTFDKAKTQ